MKAPPPTLSRPPPSPGRRPRGEARGAPAGRAGSPRPTTSGSGSSTSSPPSSSSCVGGIEALLMRIQLGAPDNTFLDAGDLQRDPDHARHDDGLPLRRADDGGVRELHRAAADRRARHGLPAPERPVLLAVPGAAAIVFYARCSSRRPRRDGRATPRSRPSAYSPSGGIDAWIFLIHLTGISSILGAINLYVTIANMRAPGMGWGAPAAVLLGGPDFVDPAHPRPARRSPRR